MKIEKNNDGWELIYPAGSFLEEKKMKNEKCFFCGLEYSIDGDEKMGAASVGELLDGEFGGEDICGRCAAERNWVWDDSSGGYTTAENFLEEEKE